MYFTRSGRKSVPPMHSFVIQENAHMVRIPYMNYNENNNAVYMTIEMYNKYMQHFIDNPRLLEQKARLAYKTGSVGTIESTTHLRGFTLMYFDQVPVIQDADSYQESSELDWDEEGNDEPDYEPVDWDEEEEEESMPSYGQRMEQWGYDPLWYGEDPRS